MDPIHLQLGGEDAKYIWSALIPVTELGVTPKGDADIGDIISNVWITLETKPSDNSPTSKPMEMSSCSSIAVNGVKRFIGGERL